MKWWNWILGILTPEPKTLFWSIKSFLRLNKPSEAVAKGLAISLKELNFSLPDRRKGSLFGLRTAVEAGEVENVKIVPSLTSAERVK
jgi:hypothetical protein